ncbi:unnamed protein product [Lactuca saligna]|uniref:K Homology domain-containing protein n=1 Tax=Lactuca saligna TaxID=75948 RepID=A0AA36A5T0_LACSI|nr:unnamed protein product [Lactuca saligna]
MNRNPRRDKFAKAKIEEPNLNLRLSTELFLKRDDHPLNDLCYMKVFGFLENFVQFSQDFCCGVFLLSFCINNTRKAHQVTETDASEAKLDRKVYRIRNKELVTVFGDDFEGMKEIQRVSKATIGILADAESNLLRHSFLDILGTAEELILDETLKTYSSLIFPVILMPPIIYGDNITIPVHKVNHVLGNYSSNLLRMEMESGAWIKIEPGLSSIGSEWRVVNVFGPQENIVKAKSLIESVICEHEELYSDEALNEMMHQFKEASCVELIDGKKLKGKQQAEEGGSGVSEKEEEDVHEEDEKEGDEWKEKRQKGVEESGPTLILASGCYGSYLHCVSHAWK